jgi:hypothetical protein
MLAGVDTMATANAEIVHDLNRFAVRGVVSEFDWATSHATMAVDAFFLNSLNDRPKVPHNPSSPLSEKNKKKRF